MSERTMSNNDTRTIKAEWLSVIFILLIQTGSGVWWAAKIDSRVHNLEMQTTKGARFTYADGRIMGARVDALVDVVSDCKAIHKNMDKTLHTMAEDIAVMKARDRQ